MGDDLCEYERQRLEHIARNHAMLVRLGLVDENDKPVFAAAQSKPADKPKTPRVKLPAQPPETLRRSSRKRGEAPDYTHEVIHEHGDELDRKAAASEKKKRPREEDEEDEEDEEAVRREMLESTTAFLRAAREALQTFVTSADGQAPSTADGWRAEAVRRWGEHVGGGVGGAERDWETWVSSRLSKPPPPSPLDLIQEYYAHDMWQLLCVCALIPRCGSWNTKHRCCSAFFGAYPSPSAFLEAVVVNDETAELRALINPLGLFDDRLKTLVSITRAFLLGPDAFSVDLAENKIRGIGPFGHHSWLIFCRDMGGALKTTADANLTAFANWRKKQPGAEGSAKTAVKKEEERDQ